MPIRNPFRRMGGEAQDEARQGASDRTTHGPAQPGTAPIQIAEPPEYKLSEINDSGVYLPPSPPQKPSFWHSKSNASTVSSNHRSLLSENEPFSISRESFESYRRSFDISARSPMPECVDNWPRGSLDARRSLEARRSLDIRRSRAPPRTSLQQQRGGVEDHAAATLEEGFEDVGLNDDPKPQKKRGIFSRFGDSNDADSKDKEERPTSSHHHFGFTGRKRAQSGGQGAEMKSMAKSVAPTPAAETSIEAR